MENKKIEKALKDNKSKLSGCLINSYNKSKETGTEYLNVYEGFFGESIKYFSDEFKKYDIKEFTISCRSTNTIDVVADFIDCGWKFDSVVQVNNGSKDFITGECLKISAFKMVQ